MQEVFSKFYNKKTILITGASGYIGSSLSNYLSFLDCNLKVNINSSWRPKGKQANLTILNGDVSDLSFWTKALYDVDYVFHLSSIENTKRNIKREVEVNVISILHLLNIIKEKSLSTKIIFSSSSNIFGDVSSLPVNENSIDTPASIWSINKLLVEQYLKLHYKKFNINAVSLRLPNVYGVPSNKDNIKRTVINKVISNALKGEELFIYKNHKCIRDYMYIDDAISAFLYAGLIKRKFLKGQFYVIGSDKGTSISEAWSLISEEVSKKIGKVVPVNKDLTFNLEHMEFRNFVAKSSNFKKLTGWNSEITFEKGIRATIDTIMKLN